jgi:hypothetical protein
MPAKVLFLFNSFLIYPFKAYIYTIEPSRYFNTPQITRLFLSMFKMNEASSSKTDSGGKLESAPV